MAEQARDATGVLEILDDPVGWVRESPQLFLRNGRFTSEEAAAHVMEEALLCGAQHVQVVRQSGWWIIVGDVDWLAGPSSLSSFWHVIPYEEGGANSMRSELVLTAFASRVVTASRSQVTIIKGDGDQELDRFVESQPHWERLVAFRP